jgi:hypothetical protein
MLRTCMYYLPADLEPDSEALNDAICQKQCETTLIFLTFSNDLKLLKSCQRALLMRKKESENVQQLLLRI